MNFIFIRHSEYQQPNGIPSAMLPHPITVEGIHQAKMAAKNLVDFFKPSINLLPSQIECSSLLRSYQTAEIIADYLKTHLEKSIGLLSTDELVERNLGTMANIPVKLIEDYLANDPRYIEPPENWKSSREYKLPFIGAESLKEAGHRVAQYIKSHPPVLKVNPNNGYRIIIGHDNSFRHACPELGILTEPEIDYLKMYVGEPMVFEKNNSHWKLIHGEWQPVADFLKNISAQKKPSQ